MADKDKLTQRQAAFVAHYANVGSPCYGNQQQAALAAGYAFNTARQACVSILANPSVSKAIENAKTSTASKMQVSEDEVIEHIVWGLQQARDKGNHTAHARYLDLAAKVLGMYRTEGNHQLMPQIIVNMPAGLSPERRPVLDGDVIDITE